MHITSTTGDSLTILSISFKPTSDENGCHFVKASAHQDHSGQPTCTSGRQWHPFQGLAGFVTVIMWWFYNNDAHSVALNTFNALLELLCAFLPQHRAVVYIECVVDLHLAPAQ